MKKVYSFVALFLLFVPIISMGQVTGDFQTKTTTGNWSDFNAWNIYNSSAWIPAVAGQIPLITASVFIQNGHTINVDITTAVCNDLNFTATGTTLKVIIQANNILTIYGNLNQFAASNIPFPSFGAGAKLVFAGNSNQVITNSGSNTNLNTVEINKSGGIFTLPAATTKFDMFTLTAGTLIGASGSNLQGISTTAIVNVNGGIWTQNLIGANRINGGDLGANCTLNISSGTMILSTTSSRGYNFSNVTITNGGILNLNNDITAINTTTLFSIDATSTLNTAMVTTPSATTTTFLGTVNYNHTAAQDIINTIYSNLILSGGGSKTPSANLTISKNITISGAAILPLGSFSLSIGGNWTNYATSGFIENTSTVDFNGTTAQLINTTGGEDFFKLNKSGTGTLTLNSDVRLGGTSSALNISAGVLDAGTFTLSGTASTDLIMSGGTLKLAKLTNTLPEFLTTTYSLSSGIIELYGSGAQVLRGGRDYRNLTFSGSTSTTLPSNPTSINGTVYITGTALLDIGSSNGFGGINTNLTMDGGRLKMAGSTGDKPDIDGTYNLTAGVIEFAGSNATPQPIKGKTNVNVTSIIYKNIEVTGTNVGTSNDNIYLNDVAGSLVVKNAAIFSISSPTIRASTSANSCIVTVENNAIFKTGNNNGFSGYTEGFGNNSSIHSNIAASNISLIVGSTVDYISIGSQVISNQIPYQHFIISSTSGTKTAPSGTLTIQGNFTKSSTSIFVHNNGTILLNGVTQSFAGLVYNNLWLDNTGTKTLLDDAVVIDSLKIGNTITDPITILELSSKYLTLKSTAAKTARLATVAPNATITYGGVGRFVIERNITPRRAWRLMTAPVVANPITATSSMFTAWQKGGATSIGSGIFISGKFAPAGGLDVTPLMNYSLKLYDGTSFVNVDDTKIIGISGTASTPGTPVNYGMFLFVRGDRSSTALFYPPFTNETTLSDTGMMQIKTQTFNLSGPSATGFSLVGNPYAAEVNMNEIMAASVNVDKNKYYLYDPHINIEQGGYLTYSKNISGAYTSAPLSPGGQKNNLYSSQAFYVERTGAGATITFTENNKSIATPASLFRPAFTIQSFRSNLYLLNADSSTILADGNIVQFDDSYLNDPDKENILKFTNIKENFGLRRNTKIYAVENRKPVVATDTIFLHLLKTSQRNYQLEFVPQNINPLLTAELIDNYTGLKIPVSILTASTHSFSINTDSASAASNRFSIILNAPAAAPIVLSFTSIKATQQQSDIVVEWAVENEENIRYYEVEKSIDEDHFIKVNSIDAKGLPNTIMYSWIDKNILKGDNFFRIKSIAKNGAVSYSRIVKIKVDKVKSDIEIYLNSATNSTIGVQFLNQPKGIYKFRLMNNLGQLIVSSSYNHSGENTSTSIKIDNGKVVTGIFLLQVVKPDNTIQNKPLFIKIK